jgi:tetratricopeptide (TPR) repeat protein
MEVPTSVLRTLWNLRRLLALLACLLLTPLAHAWTEGLQAAAQAVANNTADATQQMMVFVHNKELNLMAQEGLIRDRAYAVCQDEFNRLNKQFIDKAFKDSGLMPNSSEVKLNPGTDTDINVTTSGGRKIKLQDITDVENKYQAAIKDHFSSAPGVDKTKLPSGNIDTNTDFMPHPANTDPGDFKQIAEHINANHGTAYTDPKAASAQGKLGDKGAKITAEEAGSFSSEMKRLANEKMTGAAKFREDAARIRSSNPGEAARLEAQASQYEYQAAKYHSRMTDINNHMRGQYGLPPKKGALDEVAEAISKIGRNPYSSAEVKMVSRLHAQALQNSADNMIGTMLEIARKNPAALPQIRQIIAAESQSLSAAGAAKAATRLEAAVKDIEAAAKWAAFKEAAKDLSGFNATTKVSVVMTAGGALLIGYQGVQIALSDVKATDTVWDFVKNVYIHAGWEGTGIGPAFEEAQKEELDRYMKEIMAGRDPSMFKHVTFTILKTGIYMGKDALIGILTLPDTIWEMFTQEKEMEAYAAMQNELAAAMRQMILDRQAFDTMMVKMRKMGLHPEDTLLFLNCMCAECGGMLGGIYNPSFKTDIGHGPCQCNGPLTIWKTPLPTGNKDRMYACFNNVTKLRHDQAQDIFNKWHQQALNENAQSVAKELAGIKQEIAKGNLENDEELVRRLADQFAAIQPLLLPADADWVKAMIGPHLVNHAHKQAEAGNLPRAVEDMDKAIDKVGIRGAQNEADSKQWRDQYKQWDPVWKEFKAKRFPEVDALLGKRQIQRAAGEIAGIEAQLKGPYSRKLPPAYKDPDFLRLKARVDEQQKAYNAAIQDAWKRSGELQKANDPRGAAEVLEGVQKAWEHPPETVNNLNKQISYDRGLVGKAEEHKLAGQTFEGSGSLAGALERYTQSVAIQRDAALESKIGQLKQGQAQGTKLWNEGKALFDGGRAVGALAKFKESVGVWPEASNKRYVADLEAKLNQTKAQAAALWNEGKAQYDAGRPLEALTKFKESLKIWPDAANAQYVQQLEAALARQTAAAQAAQQAAAQQAAAQQAAAQAAVQAAAQAAAHAAPPPGAPDPIGIWRHHPEATWKITRAADGGYYGDETGLGNARGPAHWTPSGTFRIEYRTRDGGTDGYYEVRFTPDGNNANGEVREITGQRRTASTRWTRLSGGTAVTPSPVPVVSGPLATSKNDPVIFENGNTAGVYVAPTKPTTVTFNTTYTITFIQTYHWNHARGAIPGTVGLRDSSGHMYGPWQMSGAPGQGGVVNAYWNANPNVTVPSGTYTVVDSDPASWAQNSGSQGAGFVRIEGRPVGGGRAYTSQPRDPTPAPQPLAFQIDLANRSNQPVHLFIDGKENFGPQNKVSPGGSRTVTVTSAPSGTTFVAGRDGNRLATCRWDGAGVPIVVFNDPAKLSCAVGIR